MSKLRGPLFSIDAKGKLGNALVYSSNKNIKRASKHFTPRNPRTILQQDNRSIMRYAVWSWQTLTDDQKESYTQSAKNLGLKMSGYNYYLQTYIAAYKEAPPPPPPEYILDGLLSWWKMDENAGDNVYDSIGIYHGIRTEATWTPGKHNSALNFVGGAAPADWVTITPVGPSISTGISIMAWVYKTGTGTGDMISSKRAAGTYDYMFGFFTEKLILVMSNINGPWNNPADTTVPLNEWVFVSVTWDGSTIRYYLNGQPDGSFAASGTPTQSATNAWIGMMWTNQWGFRGTIDEVAIYNRALEPAEIQENYEAFL
jgi:hypothetical protein